MATKQKEVKQWITVNGRHVPVYEGESVEDAVKKVTKKSTTDKTEKPETKKPSVPVSDQIEKDNDLKEKQIKDNEKQAEKASKSSVKITPINSAKKKLEDRLSGDRLEDAKDMIAELKANEAEIDDNGYVHLYHHTKKDAYDSIMNSGKMTAKEDGVFFTTKRDGQAEGFGDEILEFDIPVEKLQIDDEFGDEAHVRIPLANRNAILDVSSYIRKPAAKENSSSGWDYRGVKEYVDKIETRLSKTTSSKTKGDIYSSLKKQDQFISAELERAQNGKTDVKADQNALLTLRRRVRLLMKKVSSN